MHSNRVLLSDHHYHPLSLTEQEIGIASHALSVLWEAFNEESEYADKVFDLRIKLNKELQVGAVEER